MQLKSFALVAALVIPSFALADNTTKTPDKVDTVKLADADVTVVAHLHHVNQMEIDMGKTAQKNGTAAVKRYGDTLVRDHSTADKDLTAFATKRGLTKIPAAKPADDTEKKAMKDQMMAMTVLKLKRGADFDRAYLQMMVEGHDGELAKTDPTIARVSDTELKSMLEARKATLQRHADAARELQKGNTQAAK